MQPPESETRPITTGSVLREALAVFARHWWRYLALTAVVYVPWAVVSRLIPSVWSLVSLPLQVTFLAVGSAAVAWAVIRVSEVGGLGLIAYLRIGPQIGRLLVASLASTVAVVLGLLALIVPGLLLIARWIVFVPAIVVEPDSGLGLDRSSALTSGHRWVGFWVCFAPAVVSALPLVLTLTAGGAAVVWLDVGVEFVFVTYSAVAAAVLYQRLINAVQA